MNNAFITLFIKRPVFATALNLMILCGGYLAFKNVPVRQYPRSDMSVVTVKTAYIGADADLVRGFITTPLERVIGSADGIDYIESKSSQGISEIKAFLRLNFDPNDALTQIQTKIAEVRSDLPVEAEVPAVSVETSDNRFASIYLSFTSDTLGQSEITDYLMRVVQPRLSAVPGVQKADILGARKFAMRVWLDSNKMAARNVSPAMVRQVLIDNNTLSPIGSTKSFANSQPITINTDAKTIDEFKNIVVKNDKDNFVRIQDIAEVVLGAENYDEEVRFGGKTATFMGVWVLPTASVVETINNVRKVIPEIEQALPAGMKFTIPYDSTKYIRDALNEVYSTLIETILIVIAVIFLFIGSFRSVFVPVVAIPLSLLGGIGIMFAAGFTLNLLTLLAIVLSVGLVVDDAIVVLENVERHVEDGKTPYEAAMLASKELFIPIIAMTITLAAVYIPIALQGGLTGALFREFALTLAGSVLISGFVALTLSPMMASKLVRKNEKKLGFVQSINDAFESLKYSYLSFLKRSLTHKNLIMFGASLFIFFLPILYMGSMKELAPREDQGVIFGIVQAAPNATIDETSRYTAEVLKAYQSFPEYENSFQLSGPTFGFSGMITKPWSERKRSTQQLEGELWGKAAAVPGVQVIVTTPPPLPGGSDFPIEFVISSTASEKEIAEIVHAITMKAMQSGAFMFIKPDLQIDLPQTKVVLNKDKVAAMGLSMVNVGRDLGVLLGGAWINRFAIDGRSYRVIPQVKRSERLTSDDLNSLYVTGPNTGPKNTTIPLASLASVSETVQPRSLGRFQQLNAAKIQGAVIPGTSLDAGLKALEAAAKEVMPSGYMIDYGGESRQLRTEGSSLAVTFFWAIVCIFLVLASQFESFKDPFIILAGSVPLALAGALSFVFLGATSLNIYSQVGLITLVGLIAKNGILIVEFANHLLEQGLDRQSALLQALDKRFRPIMMTTVATVIGHMPLVFARGPGAGARSSIGIVLVSGMIIGTLFTLFVVPSIYLILGGEKKDALVR